MNEELNIILFKKNLRITDNEAIFKIDKKVKTLWVFVFEDSIMYAKDFSNHHLQFIYESVLDLENNLKSLNIPLLIFKWEIIETFNTLTKFYNVKNVYSTQETWNYETFKRDLELIKYLKKSNITFYEFENNWVVRWLKSRDNWSLIWNQRMKKEIYIPQKINKFEVENVLLNITNHTKEIISKSFKNNKLLQVWWETYWKKVLESFLKSRVNNYSFHISKPYESQNSCSRLSPYITNWNLSVKYIYQKSLEEIYMLKNDDFGKQKINQINFFLSRIHWQSHFIQKLESQFDIEWENLNSFYDNIRTQVNQEIIDEFFEWKTTIPIIDASIECLKQTWRINFRTRAMLVSYICNTMLQPWQAIAPRLAWLFIDYEPWIHYSQIQMQAWTTWINTIRIYNPLKLWIEKDEKWLFVKKWIPEYKNKSIWEIYDKSKMKYDVDKLNKIAKEVLWWVKKENWFKDLSKEILEKHWSRKEKEKKGEIKNQLILF